MKPMPSPAKLAPATSGHDQSGEMPIARAPQVVEALARRLNTLTESLDLGAQCAADADDVFRRMIAPWSRIGVERTGRGSDWVSQISDDNTPVEFSITLSPQGSEVRVLFEPQGEVQSLNSNRAAALAAHEELAREFGADLTRFRQVQDLFLPESMQGPFALWSAAVFARDKAPSFKAYFNVQARGPGQSPCLVEEALRRLGMPKAWSEIATHLAHRGPHYDELKYFALDLTAGARSRVKVYVRHHDSTPADLERAACLADNAVPGEASHFARALSGDVARFTARATFTCAAFVEGEDALPPATTHYIPVCAYAETDAVVRDRVAKFMLENGLDDAPYRRTIASFAQRPLAAGVGMQSWVALRRWNGEPRLTVYLGSESRTVFAAGSVPAGTSQHVAFASAEEVVRCVSGYSLAAHPLIQHIERTHDAELLWLLINNTYQGASVRFSQWLAWVTAIVEDERARSLLARQLNEEMGDGDVTKAHSRLMTGFLEGIEPLRPHDLNPSLTEPGFALRAELEKRYCSSDQYEALAALMAGEICAQQLIASVAVLLQPHLARVDLSKLTWLTHHNEVEGAHADESLQLAQFVPAEPEAIRSLVKGAFGVHTALWQSMDAILARRSTSS